MSTPLNVIARETFTSDGVSQTINLNGEVDRVVVRDITNFNTPANSEFLEASWSRGMNDGTALVQSYTGAAPATSSTVAATDGISLVNTSLQNSLGAANTTVTAVSQAAPAVVSLTDTTGLADGDVVRLSNTTGMFQVASMDFTIGGLVANTSFQLSFLDSSGFAAAATAGTVRKVNNPPLYSPRQFYVTNITQAASAVVTLSVAHDVQVGEAITMNVPAAFGMREMNGLRGTVTAVDATTNTITLDIDSSAFTAFAFPASAVGYRESFPQAVRFGNKAPNALAATDNVGAWQVQLGTAAVGDVGDSMEVFLLSGTNI